MLRHERRFAGFRCVRALAWCCAWALAPATAATLADKARESGCTGKPVAISSGFFKCATNSGVEAYFNVPDGRFIDEPAKRPADGKASPTPSGFPRVDNETQKGRDELRRRVLTDELAAEEKLLAKARQDYGTGSPAPLPEERSDAQKYADRIGRLRQTVQLHERNVEALRKELASGR